MFILLSPEFILIALRGIAIQTVKGSITVALEQLRYKRDKKVISNFLGTRYVWFHQYPKIFFASMTKNMI